MAACLEKIASMSLAAIILGITISANHAAAALVTIPFVGCPGNSGDNVNLESTRNGKDIAINLNRAIAVQLAYYSGPYLSGIVAPRGWSCYWRSSIDGNYKLIVSPSRPDIARYKNSNGYEGIESTAISLEFWDGGTAGRIEVQALASRYFVQKGPTAKSNIIPIYPTDIIVPRFPNAVEFITPAAFRRLVWVPLGS